MKRAWICGLLFASTALRAQTVQAPLETEASSAKVASLGRAGLALDDGSDWLEGPSGLAALDGWSLRADQQILPAGIQRQWLEGLSPLTPWMGLALGLGYTSFGALEARDANGARTGDYEPKRLSGALGLGVKLWDRWQLGTSLSAYQESLGADSFTGFSPSLSVGYQGRQAWCGVVKLKNDGAAVGYSQQLPFSTPLLLAAQAGYSASEGLAFGLGAELRTGPIALRVGEQIVDGVGLANLNGLSVGLGAQWQTWTLDYAWLPLGDVGSSHRFGLSYAPQRPAAAPMAQATPQAVLTALLTPLVPPEVLPPPLPDLVAPQPASATAGPALELEFRLPESTSDQAILADEKGDAAALALYQEAIKKDPADTRAWMGLGHLYYRQHDEASALQCFDQVLRLNPTETALKDWVEKARARKKAAQR